MSLRLKDKIAIVTGAARGNGKGMARAMVKEGATVFLWDILELVEETAKEIDPAGQKAFPMKVDISDAERVNRAVTAIVEKHGRVDILINNAAMAFFIPFMEVSDEMRDRMFSVNIIGTWNCTRAVLTSMLGNKHGKIINIASVSGPRVSAPGLTAYSITKGGICGLTRTLALELAEFGINVNAILPGFIDTPMLRGVAKDYGVTEESFINTLSGSVPLKRLGTIEEMGDLAVFLASDESKYITGQEIVIDGGNIIQEEKHQD